MENRKRAGVPATADDVSRLFGEIDDDVLREILDLHPTIADLEKAAQWIAGDRDLDHADGQILTGTSGEIVTLLATEEEDEPPRV
jgi:hypothetical protein